MNFLGYVLGFSIIGFIGVVVLLAVVCQQENACDNHEM